MQDDSQKKSDDEASVELSKPDGADEKDDPMKRLMESMKDDQVKKP